MFLLRVMSRLGRHATTAIALLGCRTLVDPPLPSGAQAYAPPATYSKWWQMVEECSGRHRPLAGVSWFSVPTAALASRRTGEVDGYWSAASNRIVIDDRFLLSGGLVRHEMLHSLMVRGDHPRDDFLGRCGGIVDCAGQCLVDAGAAPSFVGATIAPESLVVIVDVTPSSPSSSINDGLFWATVSVTNPRSVPVRAVLSARGVGSQPFSFYLQSDSGGVSGGIKLFDSSLVEFRPGETKRHVFDFRVGTVDSGATAIAPGVFTLGGGFAGHWAVQTLQINR